MREIMFRGKRVDNGEWIYGYLCTSIEYLGDKNPKLSIQESGYFRQVVPETVGQYTGLKDKNDKEIYEGDIVCDRWANFYTPIFRNGIYMAYNVKDLHLTKQEPSTQFNVISKNGCEVIGNIHENSKLLEASNGK